MRRADWWWLTGQGVLFLLAFVVVPATDGVFWRLPVPGAGVAGVVVFGAGVVVGLVAAAHLGRQLVPQPSPIDDGAMVETGLYALVRHPIYLAVLLLISGAVIRWLSVAGLMLLAVAFLFFDRKSAYEERLLCATYPGYARYRERVRWKLVPGLR
jgi:protein-S-isoprenylcysteine O-methyltransferase Ste14